MRLGSLAAACAFAVSPLAAQDSTRSAQDSAPRVFLDCPDTFCDFDYYRTEITFVNWVRDRQFAQVHVLVTTQSTGGGQQFTVDFIGSERFAGAADTLHWISTTSDTQDDIRRGLARTFRLGLIRFVAKTAVAPNIEISYNAPANAAAQVHDPWNYWVFRAQMNGNLATSIAPAIEYDAYPYSASTRRLLTFRYEIGPKTFRYRDTTIFNRVAETRFNQLLNVSLSVKQPWGSTGIAVEGSNYLHDFRKNRVTVFGNGEFRLYKGLSLNFVGSVALIHDQLFLPKAGATEQEVLLRRRQLATSYNYFTFFGLSYTFGSKFANVVNPRFEGGGGGFFIIQ